MKAKTRTNQPIEHLEDDVKEVVESATDGTLDKVLGLDGSGKLVKGEVGGGSEPVVAYEGVVGLPEGITLTDWTLHRAIKDSNILWVVLTGRIAISISGGIPTNTPFFTITLPEEISSKIYRTEGSTCNNEPTSSGSSYILQDTTQVNGAKQYSLWSRTPNTISLETSTSWSLGQGGSFPLNIRIPLFLDIGSN